MLNHSNGEVERTEVSDGKRQIGASMMEQLVPEITTHALSYLDYPSLCRLSMTNSSMRRAANDDNAWKALYHKVYFFLLFFSFLVLPFLFVDLIIRSFKKKIG